MKDTTGLVFGLMGIAAFLYGYVMNIVIIARAESLDGMTIVRCLGAFIAPLGAVLGYVP
jgi:hypothetical protein